MYYVLPTGERGEWGKESTLIAWWRVIVVGKEKADGSWIHQETEGKKKRGKKGKENIEDLNAACMTW